MPIFNDPIYLPSSAAPGGYAELIGLDPATGKVVIDVSALGLLMGGSFGFKSGVGIGGTVTQQTSKSTGVTLNTLMGQITLNNSALTAGSKVAFTVTDSLCGANDMVMVQVVGANGSTPNSYRADVCGVAAGSFGISIENFTGGALSESPIVGFMILKGVIS